MKGLTMTGLHSNPYPTVRTVGGLTVPASFPDENLSHEAGPLMERLRKGVEDGCRDVSCTEAVTLTTAQVRSILEPFEAGIVLTWWLTTAPDGHEVLVRYLAMCCDGGPGLESLTAGQRLTRALKDSAAILYPMRTRSRRVPPLALLQAAGDGGKVDPAAVTSAPLSANSCDEGNAEGVAEKLLGLVGEIGRKCSAAIERQRAEAAEGAQKAKEAQNLALSQTYEADLLMLRKVRRHARAWGFSDADGFRDLVDVVGIVGYVVIGSCMACYENTLARLRAKLGEDLDKVLDGTPPEDPPPAGRARKK